MNLNQALGMPHEHCNIKKAPAEWDRCKVKEDAGTRKCYTHFRVAIDLRNPFTNSYTEWCVIGKLNPKTGGLI